MGVQAGPQSQVPCRGRPAASILGLDAHPISEFLVGVTSDLFSWRAVVSSLANILATLSLMCPWSGALAQPSGTYQPAASKEKM